jgi:hypothetical protein
MTNQIDSDLVNTVLQLLTSEGSSGFAEGLRLLVDEAMVQERSAVLQARPYERCEGRLGRANGFKPKTLASRVGPIQFRVPQVREGVDFYPSALEKGIRSERALMLSLAEMYVQGVSTRKVTKIVEELCGHSVSSTQVSNSAAKLDVELLSWRERPLGACSYMILDARYEKVRHGGQFVDCAVLIAIGVGPDGNQQSLPIRQNPIVRRIQHRINQRSNHLEFFPARYLSTPRRTISLTGRSSASPYSRSFRMSGSGKRIVSMKHQQALKQPRLNKGEVTDEAEFAVYPRPGTWWTRRRRPSG